MGHRHCRNCAGGDADSIQKNMFRENDSFRLKFSDQSKKWVEIVTRIGSLHKSILVSVVFAVENPSF